jgi:hypothetical protein
MQPEIKGLVSEERDNIAAESPIAGGLRHAESMEEIPLRYPCKSAS